VGSRHRGIAATEIVYSNNVVALGAIIYLDCESVAQGPSGTIRVSETDDSI
jgi:hypothetical protein